MIIFIVVTVVVGIIAGLLIWWHHKDETILGNPTPAADATTVNYVNELLDSGCCQKRAPNSTIGEEIEGCDRNNCCKDE